MSAFKKLHDQAAPLSKILALAVASVFFITPALAQDEPPGRVARVSYTYGNISFADAGSNNWLDLVPNRPLSSGDSLLVPAGGKAELHVGANALRLQETSRISFNLLDDDNTQIDMSQGSMVLRIRNLSTKENFDIRTPNLVFSLQEPGEYRINVNDDNTTTVQVRHGVAVARGERDTITIRQGEQSRFSGSNLQHSQISGVQPLDSFDLWAADRDRAEENVETARYVSREVIGYEQLDQYGAWETTTDYGAVWYPRQVSVTWAPYRDGNWVWVAPWGWTWVDRAPWGFAPYHYGRWAFISNRWAWVPGPRQHNYRPVYAPALVAFVGDSSYINGSYAARHGAHNLQPSIAWFPLGPGEAYRPSYTRNAQYIQRLNQSTIVNTTLVNNRYINQGVRQAVTVVPTNTFVRGEHVLPASTSKIIVQNRQTPAVLTEAPSIAPVSNNRFGEARLRNMNEGEQYRQRNLVMTPGRVEPGNSISNLNSNGSRIEPRTDSRVDIRPQMRTGETNNYPAAGIQNGNNIRQQNNAAGLQTTTPSPVGNANVPAPVNNAAIENNRHFDGSGNNNNNNSIRPYGNNTPGNNNGQSQPNNSYNPRPVNLAPATATVTAPATAPVNAAPASPGITVRSPVANTVPNNAIMATPNVPRPTENIDRSQRNGNGSTWNNSGQQDVRSQDHNRERPVERPNERPVERPVHIAPQLTPQAMPQPAPQPALPVQQAPRMETRSAPMPQPVQQAPRVETRPAPMPQPVQQAPRIEARPAPAPAPAAKPEPAKEKDDARNAKMRNLSER